MRLRTWLAATAAGSVLLALGVLAGWSDGMTGSASQPAPAPGAIALAVLGDSNSHSYQDRISFPPGTRERGGPLHARTFQWTEVLARLRGREFDLGPWETWGRNGNVAWARELIGLRAGRAPKKQDFRYNFANSGAACKNLMGERGGQRFRQAPRLVQLMDDEPERWRNGVVVIRIGHNDWASLLDTQALDPAAPALQATTNYCLSQIGAAIRLIHATHPGTRILLVGVLTEADDPGQFDKYRSAAEMANIHTATVAFNAALQKLATSEKGVAFFDDMGWFARYWGTRGPDGQPDYKTVAIGPTLRVTNTAGDDPANALLDDHHAGLVWNALWAQALVARLREAFALPLTPIGDDELARFVASP